MGRSVKGNARRGPGRLLFNGHVHPKGEQAFEYPLILGTPLLFCGKIEAKSAGKRAR